MNETTITGAGTTDTAVETGREIERGDSAVVREQSTDNIALGNEATQGGTRDTTDRKEGGKEAAKYQYVDEGNTHVHLLNGKQLTGTSSVLSVIAKPLTWWAVSEGLKTLGWPPLKDKDKKFIKQELRLQAFGQGHARMSKMSVAELLAALDGAYYAHSKSVVKSADKGKDMHAELEEYVKRCITTGGLPQVHADDPAVKVFAAWAVKNVKKFLWSELYTFSEKEWLGGISDCGAELNDGRIVIIDFKSSKDAYISQFWQIAGYDIQVTESGGYTRDGKKVFDLEGKKIDGYIVFPFGAEKIEPKWYLNTEGAKRAFLAAVEIYKQTPKDY